MLITPYLLGVIKMQHSTATTISIDNLTLESVQANFNHWRENRGQDKKIPDFLWQQISKILPHYPQYKILDTLKLNHYQLRKNLNLIQKYQRLTQTSTVQHPCIKETAPPFVKAFLPISVDQTYHVEWQKVDGSKLIISHLDVAGLNMLMQNWSI